MRYRIQFALLWFLLVALDPIAIGAEVVPPVSRLGDIASLDGWQGLQKAESGAILAANGEAVFRYPAGPRGWYKHGFRSEHDGSRDWRVYVGVQIDCVLLDDAPTDLTVTLRLPQQPGRDSLIPSTKAVVRIVGRGNHRVMLPWEAFEFKQAQPAFLKYIAELGISSTREVKLVDARVVKGERVVISAPIQGKSATAGGEAEYEVEVSNCADIPQSIVVTPQRHGWEAMTITINPTQLELKPGESALCRVRVKVPDNVAPGGHEKQVIQAIANGDASAAARLTLITAATLPHPHILHTARRWEEVRQKMKDHNWARAAQKEYVDRAARWEVPEVAKAPKNLTGVDDMGPYLFVTNTENDLMAAGIAYQLTGNKDFAEKVRTYMLRLSDLKDGYPVTLRGCNQGLVQEGHFFQHIAMMYDATLPSGLYTAADQTQIETTLRLLIETIEFETSAGAINNWNLSELLGALYSGLAMGDLSVAERFFSGPGGAVDQLSKGVLNDGWWYECSISYNVWCATEFTQCALALQPWGINFTHMEVPVSYSPNYSLRPFDSSALYGMSFEKWGSITRNSINIKHMWDALPTFTDYRGVMFGVNDATERRVTGEPYEIAYYVYRDPMYATLIKQGGGKRDLLYGVPQLPAETPEKFRDSAYADNVGVAMLRSQTPDRPIREQIQAVLHYGTHGGFHGHFDRASLLHLSRYGRSFFNPEMVWYSYAPFMYKFYVQNSTSKNMVVVDRKMQEPVESQRLLWHTGKLMQATAVQTRARWSTPPYGGMVYPEQGYKSLHEKSFGEGRFIPKPEKMPEYGSVTDYTEPVLQRRLMVVTDDYVVLADYLKGDREHTFESLFQMKGFKGMEGAEVKPLRHDSQWDANPILDAQFVTDCAWFSAASPVKTQFVQRWGAGADNEGTRAPESEDGELKLDVHTLWPPAQELMLGTAPEAHPVEKRLFWTVKGDDKNLAEGKFGAWILGRDQIDVPVEGIKELQLETRVELAKRPTIFWGNARVVTADGKTIPLDQLPMKPINVQPTKQAGTDYFGGPIKIAGTPYTAAIAAEPADAKQTSRIVVDLSSIQVKRFQADIGGDYPLGDESQRRKTFASKVVGQEARFLTIIEPFETTSVIESVRADDANTLTVTLNDGRTQKIAIKNLQGDGADIGIEIIETRDGATVRQEASSGTP
ncbi:MAG: hypothetical protein H7144_10645 [Burkholderiales bacterium]|nr:hypothetical protein [Phycisphaerae bacterium]